MPSYEFVVTGSLGPYLQSVLADLLIEPRCGRTRLIVEVEETAAVTAIVCRLMECGIDVDSVRILHA